MVNLLLLDRPQKESREKMENIKRCSPVRCGASPGGCDALSVLGEGTLLRFTAYTILDRFLFQQSTVPATSHPC